MKSMIKTGRYFYAIALIVFGIQQFYYGTFSNYLFPPWQIEPHLLFLWSYLFGILLIAAGLAIVFEKYTREVFLIAGGIFLTLFIFAQIPYLFFSQPNHIYHLGLWSDPLEEIAYSGGAFIMAGTYKIGNTYLQPKSGLISFLEKWIPYGNILFCFVIITYGITHFMYIKFVSMMVPGWFHDHYFWTYFGAIGLIGSGICIVLNIRRKLIAILLSLMIFLWFLILHLPSAYSSPLINRGNELTSAFNALLCSGTAMVIAFSGSRQAGDEII